MFSCQAPLVSSFRFAFHWDQQGEPGSAGFSCPHLQCDLGTRLPSSPSDLALSDLALGRGVSRSHPAPFFLLFLHPSLPFPLSE